MLHSTPIPDPKMTTDWRDHLEPGDVVSFRFPLAEEDDIGRPKARPCLVLDVERSGDGHRVVLAYGTTSRRKTNIGYETHVRTRGDRLAAGLDRSTRFVGKRRLSVSLHNGGFAICAATGSPVLGRLIGGPLARMHVVRARIQAERDIAVARRCVEAAEADCANGNGQQSLVTLGGVV